MEEKMDLLLKNGLVVTENECKRVDCEFPYKSRVIPT